METQTAQKSYKGIYFHTGKQRWVVTTRKNSKRIYIGSNNTLAEAITMHENWQNQWEVKHPDFNKLAIDSHAWEKKAKEIIHILSKRDDAVIRPKETL